MTSETRRDIPSGESVWGIVVPCNLRIPYVAVAVNLGMWTKNTAPERCELVPREEVGEGN